MWDPAGDPAVEKAYLDEWYLSEEKDKGRWEFEGGIASIYESEDRWC